MQAVNVLTQHGVKEERIILSNLFCTPAAVQAVVDYVPKMNILTAELHPVAPNHFGQKYFGTDWWRLSCQTCVNIWQVNLLWFYRLLFLKVMLWLKYNVIYFIPKFWKMYDENLTRYAPSILTARPIGQFAIGSLKFWCKLNFVLVINLSVWMIP